MIKVGLTGGIGAGKSLISQIFKALGIPIYNSDLRAKYLMNNDQKLKQALTLAFGDIYTPDGLLNRKALAQIVFNNPAKLRLLNSIVHPAVERDFEQWTKVQQTPYVIKESALLVETGKYKALDFTILVYAPEQLRILRTVERDKTTVEQVMARIKNQLPDQQKIYRVDFVIVNDEQTPVLPQVLNLHKFFLKHNGY